MSTLSYYKMVNDALEMSDDNLMVQCRQKERCKCGECFSCICLEVWEMRKHLREMGSENFNTKLGE